MHSAPGTAARSGPGTAARTAPGSAARTGPPADAARSTNPAATDGGPTTPQLTATARVILGMIAIGKCTGYEIKQLVDKSTRHFWAASYGQIYPELRRLERDGLIKGRDEPTGGRARTVYELTDEGHDALQAWLASPSEPLFELRDEGLLKLFFSDVGPAAQRAEHLRAIRSRHHKKLTQLREIDPHLTGPSLARQFGIGFSEFVINWCESTERSLTKG